MKPPLCRQPFPYPIMEAFAVIQEEQSLTGVEADAACCIPPRALTPAGLL
jgi:hypothetical protein